MWTSLKSYFYHHRYFLFSSLLLAIIALAWMAPMASSEVMFSFRDGDTPSHTAYIVQAKMALEEGQFPLRVAPLETFGFRYPGFQFYSQLPYTLGGIIYKFLTPTNPYSAYKIMLWLALWTGGIFIYRSGLFLTSSQIAATLSGIAYMSAPYFLVNIHARGAFAESIAQGILPIVLFYVIQTLEKPNNPSIILASIAWFALGITHIITFVYTSIFIFLLAAIFLVQTKPNDWFKKLSSLSLSYVLSWLLSLYFLAPVVLESVNLSIRKQINGINPFVSNWMTPLANLLAPTSLSPKPTASGASPIYALHPAVGWIFLLAVGTVIYYMFEKTFFPAKLERYRPLIWSFLGVFLIALFLTWSPIDIWSILPKQLWVTQFTFRFLTHVMWSGALLTAFAIVLIFGDRVESRHLIVGILIIMMASRPWLPPPKGDMTVAQLLKEPLFAYSGALDYTYRTPIKQLYGNAELPLLAPDWLPNLAQNWRILSNHWLNLGVDFPYPIWQTDEKPVLKLVGEVPLENIKDQAKLLILVNNQSIASIPLNQKELIANIPFSDVKSNGNTFNLKFLVAGETKDEKPLKIKMQHIYFEELLPKNTILPVDKTQKMCNKNGSVTDCFIDVSSPVGAVQLPILYYPKMQKIWIDNQLITGFPINHLDFNLIGLKLTRGKYHIRVKFVGLVWANWISLITWLGLIAMSFKAISENKNTINRS